MDGSDLFKMLSQERLLESEQLVFSTLLIMPLGISPGQILLASAAFALLETGFWLDRL